MLITTVYPVFTTTGNPRYECNRPRLWSGAIEVVSSKVYILGNTSFVSNEATDGGEQVNRQEWLGSSATLAARIKQQAT